MKETSESTELARTLFGISLERFATTTRADFRFAPFNALLLVGIFVLGLVVHLILHPFSVAAVVLCLGSALALACWGLGRGAATAVPASGGGRLYTDRRYDHGGE